MTQASNLPGTPVPYVLRVLLVAPGVLGQLTVGCGGGLCWCRRRPHSPGLPKVIIGLEPWAGVFLVFSAGIFLPSRAPVSPVLAVRQQRAGSWCWGGCGGGAAVPGVTVAELSVAREFQGPARMAHTILAGMTLVTGWAVDASDVCTALCASLFLHARAGQAAVADISGRPHARLP